MEQTGHALLSSNWYRVAALKPRLRGHVHIHRHVYRQAVWYVVEDRVSGKYHRFNPAAYKIIALLDGHSDMQSVWTKIMAELADETPTQDEVVALMAQLYHADLIYCDVTPDLAELFQRRHKQKRRLWLGRYANPMSVRIPLLDPDNWLDRLLGRLPFLASRWNLVLWLVVVLPAVLLAPSHWPELTGNFNEQLLTLNNIVLVMLVFPIIKLLHEFGHAIVCKAKGEEVHEMGVMLLVFFPAPYVDASSASGLASKWDRMLVGAAGMLTEMFVAALAFYWWLLIEPGVLRSVAYNVIVLASVTTVFFNANPLLRYDGYYIFTDWLESPNFGSRASRYWQYLLQRHMLGIKKIRPPATASGEAAWFICYEPLAFAYRLFVVFSIALLVSQQYFFIGVLVALWGLFVSFVLPAIKAGRFLFNYARGMDTGSRATGVLTALAAAIIFFLFVLPVPYHTTVEGVIWPPEDTIIRAGASGFATRLLTGQGEQLSVGQAVLESDDPEITAKQEAQVAKIAEIQSQYDATWKDDPAMAGQLMETLRHETAALARITEERRNLTLRSPKNGQLLIHNPKDLLGKWLMKGDIVGYVQNDALPIVRVVVHQEDVDKVRLATEHVAIKLPQQIGDTWAAKVLREIPAADKQLPSSTLGQLGGGAIPLDPRDEQGMQTLESLFEFELSIQEPVPYYFLGSRVYVQFHHPKEPIGFRIGRSIRRLFLTRFLL